jgi:hypothetical protein
LSVAPLLVLLLGAIGWVFPIDQRRYSQDHDKKGR